MRNKITPFFPLRQTDRQTEHDKVSESIIVVTNEAPPCEPFIDNLIYICVKSLILTVRLIVVALRYFDRILVNGLVWFICQLLCYYLI